MRLGNRAVVSAHPHLPREQGLVWSSGEARVLGITEVIGFPFLTISQGFHRDSLPGCVAIVGEGQVPHAQMVECPQDTEAAVN